MDGFQHKLLIFINKGGDFVTIAFIIPYVPIPRIKKRIDVAKTVEEVSLLYWDRGNENKKNLFNDPEIQSQRIFLPISNGKPFKRLNQTLKFSIKVIEYLREKKPETIHVTKTDMLLVVYIYCIFFKRNPKVIYEVSDIHKHALNSDNNLKSQILQKIIYIFEKIGFNIVNKLIVTSPYFWDNYYNKLISKDNVEYIPNAPEEIVFENYYPKKDGKFTISFIGKVRYVNQIKLLIDISDEANINVLIAGNGVGYDEVKSYAKNKENVYVYGSYNYTNEIAKLYSMSDAIYSVYDTTVENVKIALPNRLYEATYCGLPLIVSENTYLEEVVLDNKLGISVNPFDKNDILNKVLNLKETVKKKNEKILDNGKQYYQKYNSNINKRKLIELYTEV